MKKKLPHSSLILALLLLFSLACSLAPAVVTIDREADKPVTAVSPPATPTPAVTAAPTAAPTPTAVTPTRPSLPAIPTPEFDFQDLAPYRQAMLREFADEVDAVAAGGASRYYLEISLAPDGLASGGPLTLSGRLRVRYTNTEAVPLSDVYFHLYPNLPGYGGHLAVETVVVNDRVVQPVMENNGTALAVPLAAPLPPGGVADITLVYEAVVPSETRQGYNIFSYTAGTIALAGFYPAIAVYDQAGWSLAVPPPYGDATYLDTSLYQVRLAVPASLVVAASGNRVDRAAGSGETQVLTFASGPMRDFYLVMRPDYRVNSTLVDGTTVNSYYPPGLADGGQQALAYAAEALRVFNRRFGPYPYAELDVAATPTRAGGIEYPGIVVIAQSLYDQPGGFFEHATVHEVAHQWWYGLVGNDQVNEPWLDEALTNYSTVFYWEEVEGPEAAHQIVEAFFLEPYRRASQQNQDRAVLGPVSSFTEGEYSTFVYGKGPLFFHALREEVGTETYLQIMQNYYSEYKYEIVRPEDLLEIIEQVSGRPVDTLVETWLE